MNDQANNALEISSINAKLTFFVDNGEPPINYLTEDRVLERTGEYSCLLYTSPSPRDS